MCFHNCRMQMQKCYKGKWTKEKILENKNKGKKQTENKKPKKKKNK